MRIEQNMGMMDRVVRSTIGGALVINGLNSDSMLAKVGAWIGGAFIIYGLTGFDPLLEFTDTSTKPGDENNLMSKARQGGKEALQRGKEVVKQGQSKLQEQMDNVLTPAGQS